MPKTQIRNTKTIIIQIKYKQHDEYKKTKIKNKIQQYKITKIPKYTKTCKIHNIKYRCTNNQNKIKYTKYTNTSIHT